VSAREFRCADCGYPFKTADEGWARRIDLMCPSCGSADLDIVMPGRPTVTRMVAAPLAQPVRWRQQSA
jgi:DNA-directed RNA polymerase subunit RPC12/RpoP